MKLTKNFDSKEFDCKDGTKVPQELFKNVESLALELQKIRDLTNRPLKINSGYRTEKHNKKVGGASGSYHLAGLAVDLVPSDMELKDFYNLLLVLMKIGYIKKGGLKLYSSFVHYDIRGKIVLF